MRVAAIILTMLMSPAIDTAHARPDKEQCEVIKQKIRHIRSKMRAGYTRAQGERMEEQLRRLRVARKNKCR